MLDRKSKFIISLTFVAIVLSAVFMFDKYVTRHDFVIYQNEDGMPELLEE